MTKHLALLAAGLLAFSFVAVADDTAPASPAAPAGKLPPASDKKDVTYEKDMKPLFEKSCVKCHSGEKAKAKLHMDTLDGVLKGTKKDKIVEPGNSADSLIVKSVAHLTEDEDGYMPPPHNKAKIADLTPEEIGLIRAWIDQGAK